MKRNKHEAIFVAALAIIFGGMSVGFAAYQQDLTVTGQTTVAANKWDVHFDENSIKYTQIQDGVNLQDTTPGPGKPLESVTLSPDKQSISFKVNLKHPERSEDYYHGDAISLGARIVNSGSFDAKLVDLKLEGISEEAKEYIQVTSFVIKDEGPEQELAGQPYLGVETKADGNDTIIKQPFILEPQSRKPNQSAALEFHLQYVQPADPSKLPQEDVNFTITLSYKAEQV